MHSPYIVRQMLFTSWPFHESDRKHFEFSEDKEGVEGMEESSASARQGKLRGPQGPTCFDGIPTSQKLDRGLDTPSTASCCV